MDRDNTLPIAVNPCGTELHPQKIIQGYYECKINNYLSA